MPSYSGDIVEINIGRSGFKSDDANRLLPPDSLIRANNIRYESGLVEKDFGSVQWNSVALGGRILAGIDYRANDAKRFMVVASSDSKITRYADPVTPEEITGGTALSFQDGVNLVSGGFEEIGNPRKLFIFAQDSYPQVVSGDATTRSNISNGLPQWSGTDNPVDGIIHRNRLFCWLRFGATIFGSDATDHEDFLTNPLPIECFPGDGEYIAGGVVFRKRLFVFKYPQGVFVLNDNDPDADNWYFEKINGSVGALSSRAIIEVGNDVFFRNQFVGVSSLAATDTSGDINSSDLFGMLRNQSFPRERMTHESLIPYHALYHKDLKTAYFSFRGRTSDQNDYVCMIDMSDPSKPRVSWNNKDQVTCLFFYRDSNGVEHPFYGSDDGFIYRMDSENRFVGGPLSGSEYLMDFQTPHMDFGGDNPVYASSTKQFDFLEVVYEPEGDWNLLVDVYVDGHFTETLKFKMSLDKGGSEMDTPSMTLDQGFMDPEIEQSRTLQIRGSGKKISFRCYNEGNNENCRIAALRVYFKNLSSDQKR